MVSFDIASEIEQNIRFQIVNDDEKDAKYLLNLLQFLQEMNLPHLHLMILNQLMILVQNLHSN